MTETAYFTRLPDRGLLHLEGKDRHAFLQGLITNDMNTLKPGMLLYACLLTPQGKFLHDFFVQDGDGVILLECEGGARAQDLYGRLLKYRLRQDVQISVEPDVPVYATIGSDQYGLADPRHPEMGYRSFEKPENLPEEPFETWDKHRITLCVPDGSRDLIPDSSTLDEGRIDKLNGLSYDKGCYVGQELTARMHYRGLGKKHLYTILLNRHPERSESESLSAVEGSHRKEGDLSTALLNSSSAQDDIPFFDDLKGAELRSSCDNIGLALVKDEVMV